MLPDLKRETITGWLALAGTALVVGLSLYFIQDGGVIETQAEQMRTAAEKNHGKEDLKQRVERQREANQELRRTIEKLKGESGFDVTERFQIPKDEKQPGYLFKKRFVEVRQELREKAMPRGILYDENIGFGSAAEVPDDKEAPYLMSMLQLTEKMVSIAIETPTPLESFAITHSPAVETGPVTRPVLLREYPLELTIKGSLKDILWILHRISQVEAPGADGKKRDYPLILRGFTIQSENAKPKDDITQLDAVFQVAGMQFLTAEERQHDPNHPERPAMSALSGPPVFEARP